MAAGLRTALVWATALSLLAKVESPSLRNHCGDGEYYHSGICCKKCPAGTHVDDHCSMPYTLGSCTACTEGKDYTAHDNGLDMCLLCDECRSGKTMVKPCTVKSNTECRCNDGYYCPPGCEECLRCKEKCPEGKVPVQNCNATTDMECGPPLSGGFHTEDYLIGGILSLVLIGIVIGFLCCIKRYFSRRKEEKDANSHLTTSSTDDLLPSRKNSNTDALPTESQEVRPYPADAVSVSHSCDMPESIHLCSSSTREASSSEAAPLLHLKDKPGTHNGQSNVLLSHAERSAVIKPSQDELSEIGQELMNKVLVNDWRMLMRNAGLSDNEIDIIIYDNPYNTRDQKYYMLKNLYDRFGTERALCNLLNGLRKMNLINIYENLWNELLSKNITVIENKGKCLYLVKKAEQNQ